MADNADCFKPPPPSFPHPQLTQAGVCLHKKALILAACLLQCHCDDTSFRFPALNDWLFIDLASCFVRRGWEQSHTLSSTGSFGALQPTLMSRPAGVAPGAPLLASCHETSDTIRLWDAASSGLALQSLPSCGAAVRQIRAGLTPYGALLMGLSSDHVQLYCWRANTG